MTADRKGLMLSKANSPERANRTMIRRTTHTNQTRIAKYTVMVAAIGTAMSLLTACGENNEYQAPPPPAVTVAQPAQRDVIDYHELQGTSSAVSAVQVRARVQGILMEKRFNPGQMVNEGDVLFVIDPAPFIAYRDAAAATVASADAQMKLAQTTADRTERAARDGGVSELVALEERAKADAAVAQHEIALRELAIKQLDVDYATIRAPITGLVEKSPMEIGDLVGSSSDNSLLTTVYDDTKIKVNFTVPDRLYLSAIRGGEGDNRPTSVDIGTEVDEGFPFLGILDYVDPAVDPSTGTLTVRAEVENSGRKLVSGLFVRIRVASETLTDALLIPRSAVSRDQVGPYIYIVNDENIAVRRNVELGPIEGDEQVILSGLEPTDQVIVIGILRARPGSPVTPMPMTATE